MDCPSKQFSKYRGSPSRHLQPVTLGAVGVQLEVDEDGKMDFQSEVVAGEIVPGWRANLAALSHSEEPEVIALHGLG